ncbi:MAG: FmdB family zinc ribbon protein [Planctomycetota bacterium]|jgi:putative FmdB family regulatory protein
MPIFEYQCVDCGKVSEFLERTGEKLKKACTHCGGGKLKRQFSVFSPAVKQGESKRCHGCTDNTCPNAGL